MHANFAKKGTKRGELPAIETKKLDAHKYSKTSASDRRLKNFQYRSIGYVFGYVKEGQIDVVALTF